MRIVSGEEGQNEQTKEQKFVRLYHSTTSKAANLIFIKGFRDEQHLISGVWITGVRLSNNPSHSNEALLKVDIHRTREELLPVSTYLEPQGQTDEIWIIPAEILNTRAGLMLIEE